MSYLANEGKLYPIVSATVVAFATVPPATSMLLNGVTGGAVLALRSTTAPIMDVRKSEAAAPACAKPWVVAVLVAEKTLLNVVATLANTSGC